MVHPSIFRAYDIRGVYKEEFDDQGAYDIARAFLRYIQNCSGKKMPTIVLNYDARESSLVLKEHVIRGLMNEGAHVIDAGEAMSPFHYFIVNHVRAEGGMMVTASHLGPQFNGFKLMLAGAMPVSGKEFSEFFSRNIPSSPQGQEKGKLESMSFHEAYLQFLGITQEEHEAILSDPRIEFDTDGDRVMFTGAKGLPIRRDFVAALLAERFLATHRQGSIVIDERSSRIVRETILEHGGTPVLSPVGHNFFKGAMRKHDALFGAELSGHYYFKDFFFCDSGLFAAIRVREIMKQRGMSLEELLVPYEKYFHTGEVNITVTTPPTKILERIQEEFKDAVRISTLDGVAIEYEDWWCSVRASNTEPVLRLNLEARTESLREEQAALLKRLITTTL